MARDHAAQDPAAGGQPSRWLVVGLGNPGPQYAGTRHNAGSDTVRRLADQRAATFRPHKAQAQIADTWTRPGGTPLSLLLPHGYYNTSGEAVVRAMAFYKVGLERLVVIHDDIDLELARVRLKLGGGTAGNNGLKDIQRRCGGPNFYRVRIGIGRPPGRQDPADYVLKRFNAADREQIDVTLERAAAATVDLIEQGLEAAQNRHHAA